MDFHHVSVLREETVSAVLGPKNGIYVDCTLGGGGHAATLAAQLQEEALVIGLDRDRDALRAAAARLQDVPCRTRLVQRNFQYLADVLQELHLPYVDGIMFDLGVSGYQLDTPERGFSYMQDGPLDMRMDQRCAVPASTVVNTYSEEALYSLIKAYGEERWAKRIAAFIVRARRQKTFSRTAELVHVIKQAIPAGARRDGPHPAKRTFQALRIEVNNELGILHDALTTAVQHLKPGGKIGVITFHSLEDRITKQTFKELATDCICPPDLPVCTCHHRASIRVRRQVVTPSPQEVADNPRARSAKLRVAERK